MTYRINGVDALTHSEVSSLCRAADRLPTDELGGLYLGETVDLNVLEVELVTLSTSEVADVRLPAERALLALHRPAPPSPIDPHTATRLYGLAVQSAEVRRFATFEGDALELPTKSIDLHHLRVDFAPWMGEPLEATWNGKPVVDVAGEPMFAELAVATALRSVGWTAVWLGGGVPREVWPGTRVPLPEEVQLVLAAAAHRPGSHAGVFDVIGWRPDGDSVEDLVFIECKRLKRDRPQPSQRRWAAAALADGVPIESLLVVEWTAPAP